MTYQLVLQFRGDALEDYDAMIALEGELIAELGDLADIDGHDVGSNEINIFILTSDPISTFQQSKGCVRAATTARLSDGSLPGDQQREIHCDLAGMFACGV